MSRVIIKVYVCTAYNAMLIQRINFVDMYVCFYVCMHIFLSVCLSLSLPLSLSLSLSHCVCLYIYMEDRLVGTCRYIIHMHAWVGGRVGGWAGGGRDRYYRLYLGIHSQSSAVFKCFTK